MGLKFRLPSHRAFVFEELRTVFKLFVAVISQTTHSSPQLFLTPPTNIVFLPPFLLFFQIDILLKIYNKNWKILQSLFVKIDKSSHDYGFICRSTYLHEMHSFLHGSCFSYIPDPNTILTKITHNFSEYKSLLPATYDFKEMYNALRHDSIVSGIKKAVEEAFAFSEKPSMVLRPLGVEFSILNPSFSPSSDSFSFSLLNDKVAFSSLDVISLLSFVLNHAIIKQGSHFFRQTKGIPMGGNASPDIANLYCYSVEATYVDKMVNAKLWDIVAACTRIKRYIDDFACFSSTPPPAESYDMSYTCTSSLTPKNHVIDLDYIGLRLRLELGKTPEKNWIRMGVANKARKWNFTPVRFPHAGSVAPQSQGGGVFKGLCIRAICLCNNSNDLLLELVRTTCLTEDTL